MSSIFISYAREDRESARRLYRDLRRLGLSPWIDTENLLPGERWKERIRKEIREATHFIALLSSNTVDKRGVVQWEIREALETLKQVPENQIYFIPARLEECQMPVSSMEDIQWVDLFPDYEGALMRIAASLGAKDTGAEGPLAGKAVIGSRIGEFMGGFIRGVIDAA